MKKNLIIIASLTVVSFFIACGGGSAPKDIAQKFLTASAKMDFAEAKKYCTTETGSMLDMMAGFSKMAPDSVKNKKTEFTMTDEKIDGDAATVKYKETGKDKEETIKLKKVDNKWLVSVSKEDMQGKGGAGDSGASSEGGSMPGDSTNTDNAMSADTSHK